MTVAPGTRIGPYEVTGSLGAGGMGEVYRARDARLGRDVAIKILPEPWLEDPERRARFDREARVLASLNHPHIGAIYGLEEESGRRALVLELIEGPTLATRLARGPLSVDEALELGVQIASALEAAHERGIVHRDLKPGNVLLSGAPSKAKVVDFGLAKEPSRRVLAVDPDSPTEWLAATRKGEVFGTAAYMSPEQSRGDEVDRRTDIWAFGCVLYEMLTGRSPFAAGTLADTHAAIVSRDPDWSVLPAGLPSDVRRLLRRCLEKDPAERLRDAHDLRLALEDRGEDAASSGRVANEAIPQQVPARSVMVAAAMTMIGGVILGMLGAIYWLGGRDSDAKAPAEKRLEIVTPRTEDPVSFAVSPDGSRIAFVAGVDGKPQLWLRPFDSTTAHPLPGTENAEFPFWSPDGRAIAFFADRSLKRLDLEPGSIQVLAPVDGARGGSWGPDGTIVMQPAPYLPDPLVRVAATGGEVRPYEAVSGRFPHFLPGGRNFIYYKDVSGTADDKGVFVAALDGSGVRRLFDADGSAVYSAGHVLFVRGGALLAQKFDPESLALSGNAFPVAADVNVFSAHRGVPVSATPGGTVVYRTGNVGTMRQFVWADRTGRELVVAGEPMVNPAGPKLSPDGSRVAFFRRVAANNDLYLLDFARPVVERLTTDPTNDFGPIWSPDGRRIAYCSAGNLVVRSLADGAEETLRRPAIPGESACADSWSLDGRFLLYNTGRSSRSGLWVLPIEPLSEPIAFANSDFLEIDGAFSPDGKWIAYTSDESGQPEVFVGRFPGPPRKQQVSSGGGGMAVWRHDGRELFYVALDGKLMSVPLEVSANGETLEAETASPLFDARVGSGFQSNSSAQYGVAPDGKRFLLNRIVEQHAAPLTVVLDWQPGATAAEPR